MPDRHTNPADKSGSLGADACSDAPIASTNGNTASQRPGPEASAAARAVLIGSLLGLSWLGMQAVHEAGHALAARLSGGRVVRLTLHPLTISSTDVSPNPSPRLVAWSGPLVGVLAPLAVWVTARRCGWSCAYLLRFFAGFCLVANGAYLGMAGLMPVGDAQTLLRLGEPVWRPILFGAIAIPTGLRLWHGQGSCFGSRQTPVNIRHAVGLLSAFMAAVGALLMRG